MAPVMMIFAVIAAQNTGADIRNSLFNKIQSYSFKKIDQSNTGNLITIMTNDIDIIERLIFMALRILMILMLILKNRLQEQK